MLLVGIATPFLVAGGSAGADQIATLQEQAQVIATEIQNANVELAVLDENYLEAKTRVSWLAQKVANASKAIGRTELSLNQDRSHLRQVAIEAYVTGGASQSFSVLFSSTQQTAGMQQAYLQAASGNLSESETTVLIVKRRLSIQRATLAHNEAIAEANERTISSDLSRAKSVAAQLTAEEAQVKGKLAIAVAAAEQAKAAAFAAALAKAAAAQAAQQRQQQLLQQQQSQPAQSTQPVQSVQSVQSPPTPSPAPSPPQPSGGSAAQTAVNAAQSQRGVPYVWGGATPGVGFDCSGLTMWAWGQAGVSLEHGATPQYYEIQHVSMSDLQPGDLVFYGDAAVLEHVVMYIGDGEVVQAEETGTNVMDTPLWPGAFGAGRP
jgi:cell wall-associated NlpC family hydrolase